MQTKELVIVGAGIAGLSASIYARRANLDFLIFDKNGIGGQLLFIDRVDNYIGVMPRTSGRILIEIISKTLEELDIKVINEKVVKIEPQSEKFIINTNSSSFLSHSLIIATGASFKKLGLENEDNFVGKGISYCALCDGFFFKDKVVAVVGGGNTAVEEAIYLSRICKKVYLIHRRDTLRAIDYLQKELFKKNNIEIIFDSIVKKLEGKNFLESVIVENTLKSTTTTLKVDGLFIAIGLKPNTEIVKDLLELDKDGFIITDQELKTSKKGIWACGDCRFRPLRQLITSASEGAIAAIGVYRYLKNTYISS